MHVGVLRCRVEKLKHSPLAPQGPPGALGAEGRQGEKGAKVRKSLPASGESHLHSMSPDLNVFHKKNKQFFYRDRFHGNKHVGSNMKFHCSLPRPKKNNAAVFLCLSLFVLQGSVTLSCNLRDHQYGDNMQVVFSLGSRRQRRSNSSSLPPWLLESDHQN